MDQRGVLDIISQDFPGKNGLYIIIVAPPTKGSHDLKKKKTTPPKKPESILT